MADDVNKIKFEEEAALAETAAEETDEDAVEEPIASGDGPVPAPDTGGGESSFDEESFSATKNLIQNLSAQHDELVIQQRELKERLKNILENDAQLAEAEDQAKEASIAVKKRKQDLMDSVEAREVKEKVREAGEEIKDLKDSLTHHLLNYYQITGTQSFETVSGDEREFSFSARIKPAKK